MSFARINATREHVYTRICANALAYADGRRVIKHGDAVMYRYGKTTIPATVIQPGKCRVLIEHIDVIGGKRARRVRWCVPDCLTWQPAP